MTVENGKTGYPGCQVSTPAILAPTSATLKRVALAKLVDLLFLSAKFSGETELFGPWVTVLLHAGETAQVGLDDAGETVLSPVDIAAGTIADDLWTAAQVMEMLLIQDHSRMKLGAVTLDDSTHEQQHRLLPISHPEDWSVASEEFKKGGYW